MNEKKKKIGFKLILFSLLFIPGMQVLFIIGCNSKYLLRLPLFIAIIILNILFIVQLIVGLKIFIDNNEANKRKLRKKSVSNPSGQASYLDYGRLPLPENITGFAELAMLNNMY